MSIANPLWGAPRTRYVILESATHWPPVHTENVIRDFGTEIPCYCSKIP